MTTPLADSRAIAAARADVLGHAQRMWRAGLVVASAGNVSARVDAETVAITPTSVLYETMRVEEIVLVHASGRAREGEGKPSYELPTHLAVYRARPDVGGIVHTHSPAATALSVLREPLPPVIDEMAVYFGGSVRVAEYAFTGTEELGRNAVAALGDRAAALLANHGNLCVGRDLEEALHVAITMESVARVYLDCRRIGKAWVLPEEALRLGREMYERRRAAK